MDGKINEWLQTFDIVNEIAQVEDIHTERGTDTVKSLALQRNGVERLRPDYITDKVPKKQYQYMLLLKSESEVDLQRLNNLDWLDTLSDLLDKANQERNYPVIENKKVTNVSCANGITYEENEDGSISVYALQLYFDIKG